jgi:hypothetical protein
MRRKWWSIAAAVGLGLGMVLSAAPAPATNVITGSGTNPETGNVNTVSAEADFTITGPGTLELVLKNTTAGGTLLRGDTLTGIAFNLATNPALSLSSITLTPGSSIYTDSSTINNATPLAGSWTDVLGVTPLRNYGVAATGFNGAFDAGGITTGNGGTDYGIVATGTTFGDGFSGSAFPLALNSLTFDFTFTGSLGEGDVQNVLFLFGTEGTGTIPGDHDHNGVPEPAAFFFVAAGLTALGWYGRRTRLAP